MSDEKYEAANDVEQSGVRFTGTEDNIDFTCERLCFAVESFCGGRLIVPELSADQAGDEDEEPMDRLDPLFDSDDFPQDFIQLIYDNVGDIFKPNSNHKTIEFVFNCAFGILFENTNTLQSNIDALSNILSTQSEPFNKLNIKLLCLLFNLIPPDNRLRFVVMQRMLDLGKNIKTTLCQELFRGQLNGLAEWIETDWNKYMTIDDKKRLYQSASFVAKKAAENETYLRYLIAYLKLFNSETAQDKSVVDEAAQAIIAAISSSQFNTEHVMELIRSDIVCNVIKKTPKYMELYTLLDIVYEGSVKQFEAFYKENEAKMAELGLDYDNLQNKMRLLTLCALGNASQTETNTYSFEVLVEELQLKSQNELEELIISAMTKKTLFAKIDYALNQVDITRAKQRTFNKNSWMDLSKRLSLWRQNTNTVIQILHSAGLNRWRQQYMQEMAKQAKIQ
eukprot:199481_1